MKCAYASCQACGIKSKLLYSEIEAFTGLVIAVRTRTFRGFHCAKCTRKIQDVAIQETTTAGLLCPAAIYYVPVALLNNFWISRKLASLEKKEMDEMPTILEQPQNQGTRFIFLILATLSLSFLAIAVYIYFSLK